MKTIIFVCHGNICRSPCAEVIANTLIDKYHLNDELKVYSRALSYEEYGNDIYPPIKKVLLEHGHKFPIHHADKLSENDIKKADVIYYMDDSNYRLIKWQFKDISKFRLISELTDNRYVEDPWYTDRFEYVYSQIEEAVNAIINNEMTH